MKPKLRKGDYAIDESWLEETYRNIITGKIKLYEAAKSVKITTITGFKSEISMCPKLLSTSFKESGRDLVSKGKKNQKNNLSPEIRNFLHEIHEKKIGSKKAYMIAKREGFYVPYNVILNFYHNELNVPFKPKKEKIKFVRYEASEVNSIWHGDIHYIIKFNQQKYIFALIDDKSRFIINYGISEKKDRFLVLNTLREAIEKYEAPNIFWSDNGLENINNDVKTFLEHHSIEHVRTMPNTPRQNGKIERWWQKLDENLQEAISWDEVNAIIDQYVNDYNFFIPHMALERNQGIAATPSQIFNDQRYAKKPREQSIMHIDGKEILLSNFVPCKNIKKFDFRDISTMLN